MTAVDHAELKRVAERATAEAVKRVMAELEYREGRKIKTLGGIATADLRILVNEASKHIDALVSALRTQVPDSWRPIDTAPRDGTVIDAWRKEGGRETVFWGYPHHECGEMGGLCDSDWHSIRSEGWVCNYFNEFLGRSHNPFTHWMPLPAAPALRPQTAESGK